MFDQIFGQRGDNNLGLAQVNPSSNPAPWYDCPGYYYTQKWVEHT